ncbi:MAG: HTTM domain-containing protein [Myxococcales bacterium]|nr:HTTM domain-containing protein [Myxococcales bacterium]
MSPLALLALAPKKEIDVSAHIDVATQTMWIAMAMIALFFILRPELWRRMWFDRVDPRPAALTRITLGITIIWGFADLLFLQGEWLFTDQGLLLTEMARKNYGGKFRTLWDPEHGFEHWYDVFLMMTDRWSVLFVRSDPPFVYTMFGLLFFWATCMVFGLWSRLSSFMTLIMVWQLYGYDPIYFSGGDTVVRVYAYLAIFVDWGQAYSIDSWRRRRKAILGGAKQLPAPKRIAVWPQRFFMLQLACIYCATGMLKSGNTWADGSALYYALNLDHFYRVPMHLAAAWAHKLYITRISAWVVHWWEILFPLVFVGEALRGWDKDVKEGSWQGPVPRWTLYSIVMAVSILAVWTAPLWAKPLPLVLLALLIAADRLWLKPADKSGKGAVSWTVRLLSWGALVGFFLAAAYMADLGVLYYFTPPKKAPAWVQDKELIQTLASASVLAVPLLITTIILTMRAWTPRAYRIVRDYLLGKRLWLTMGFLMHLGIDVSMNVGIFVQIMVAVYPIWLAGSDIDAMWRFVLWRPAKPGEATRPPLPEKGLRRFGRKLLAPFDRAVHRVRRDPWTVVHGPSDAAVRRAALLRCWDLGERLHFELDPDGGEQLTMVAPDKTRYVGSQAGRELISLFPGLWLLWPISAFPGIGRVALAILRQKA